MSSDIGATSSNGIAPVIPDDPDDTDINEPDAVDSDDVAGRSSNIDPDADDELVPLKFLL
jgi:hypothetical protein